MRAQAIGNGRLRAKIPAEFAVALQALQLQGEEARALGSLTDDQWRGLLPMLDQARLALPFAVRRLPGLPVWVNERLSKNLADTKQNWELVETAYREIATALDSAGLEHLVLKGFTQAPDFVPDPSLRRQGDIDIYVPSEYIPAGVRVLEQMGYGTCRWEEDYREADHVPTLVRYGDWKWNGNRYDPEMPPAIDVHFCLWNDSVNCITIPEVGEFWNRRQLRILKELRFPALHPVDHAGYFALHILRDIFDAKSPAHHLLELATLLHKHSRKDDFWSEWVAMHSPRLRRMESIAFSLAIAWFSCDAPSAVTAEINSLPPQVQAWIRTCGSTPLEGIFCRTREGKLLQSLLVDAPGTQWMILWKALTPSRVYSPRTRARNIAHPTDRHPTRTLFVYLTYPAYLVSRAWMNGSAILRFLAHACMLYASRAGLRQIPFSNSPLRSGRIRRTQF